MQYLNADMTPSSRSARLVPFVMAALNHACGPTVRAKHRPWRDDCMSDEGPKKVEAAQKRACRQPILHASSSLAGNSWIRHVEFVAVAISGGTAAYPIQTCISHCTPWIGSICKFVVFLWRPTCTCASNATSPVTPARLMLPTTTPFFSAARDGRGVCVAASYCPRIYSHYRG